MARSDSDRASVSPVTWECVCVRVCEYEGVCVWGCVRENVRVDWSEAKQPQDVQ